MTMLPTSTGPSMAGPGFMGLGASPQGGMSPATQALMMFGTGLLSGDPRTQGLARGFQGVAQAYSPQAAMQRQLMQGQLEELQRRRAADEAFKGLILGTPQTGDATMLPPTAAAPSMVEPTLGGSLVDMPGGGTEPGQVQSAYRMENMPVTPSTPAGTMQTAPVTPNTPAGAMMNLPASTRQLMATLGPQHPLTQSIMAQIYKPQAAPKPTSAVQNALALGLERGTPEFNEYVRAATLRQGTQVNIRNEGNIPPGFTAVRGPEGNILRLDPIPGSPAAQEIAAGEEAKAAQQAERQRTGDIVTQDIDTVLGQLEEGFPVTGVFSAAAMVPGTKAHDVAKSLDTIKANIGFDKLQAMRAASPTGGALGQVSERENVLLQSTFGSLAQSQSEEQFRRNLTRLRETYLDIIHGKGNRPTASAPAGQGVTMELPAPTATNPETGERMRYNQATGEWEAM